ncbi:FAD-dependent oxidoreductase [Microbacteriaceae bacterium VKM Ac-2854]|nr:FAD-dependent oxidoreductase [Microbacteriaceae bacterium VKM Ac-2854]
MTDLHTLGAELNGTLFLRGDPGLTEAATGFNLAVHNDPEAVVVAADVADVVATVRFAAANGLRVHVQSTGHGAHADIRSGVLLITSALDELSIDADSRLATIGAGVRWGAVVAAGHPLGLVPDCGSSAVVGCVGYVLGGGLGPLSRTLGFGSDWVRSFRVVTGSGELVTASAAENPELFWALRGGKTGLGVVVSMQYELAAVDTVFGGSLMFAAEDAEATLRLWLRWAPSAPDSVTSSVALMRFPPLDVVPEPLRGRTVLSLRFAYIGEHTAALEAEGRALLAPLLAGAQPFLGAVEVMPTSALASIHNDPEGATPAWSTGTLLAECTDETADALLAVIGVGRDVPVIGVELRRLGGAIARAPESGDAVGGRSAAFALTIIGVPDPALFAEVLPGVGTTILTAVAPWTADEGNANFSSALPSPPPRPTTPVASAARLAAARARYDPIGILA